MSFSAAWTKRLPFRASRKSAAPRGAAPKIRRAVAEALEQRTLLSASLWDTSVTPTITSFSDNSSVELGVRFRSETPGYVTGLRFYKGADNTGTHVGHLWSASGTLLGSATFTNESATGWQEISLATPIHIDANTSYIASYFDPNGHYAVDTGYFASTSVDNPPLHAPLDASATGGEGNGVFAASTNPAGVFPGSSFNSNNYWVDVLFDTNLVPQVSDTSPAFQATYVDPSANATVTFSVPMDPFSINTGTVFLRGPGNVLVPATVSYDATAHTATIDPTGTLTQNATYTIVVKGGSTGAKSASADVLTSDFTSTFRVQPVTPNTLWPASTTPSVAAFNDSTSAELGVRFRTDVGGVITGVRFYKGAGNTGTHTGTLWTSSGGLLATATFTNETATGWQQVTFDSPVVVPAGATLIASYLAPQGHYAVDTGYFATKGVDSGPLHAPQDGTNGLGNGVFAQPSSGGVFPSSTFNSNNYWVDVVFFQGPLQQPNSPPTATPQTVNVNEDDKVVIGLLASDAESPAGDLKFVIDTLPTRGVLKYNGVAVTAGQTFTGRPANLTYEPGAETEGGTTDAFTFHVIDPEGLASDPATVSINVNKAVADGAVTLSGGILRVGGTAGVDVITISRTSTGKFLVTNGLTVLSNSIPVSSVSEIRVWGRGGFDGIALLGVSTKSLLSGGEGTDVIVGGDGDDVILGGNGDDALTGGAGNDVIAGGSGHDALLGMDGHDVLIAGSISPAQTAAGLRALGAEWAASKSTTAQEAAAIDQVVTDAEFDLLSGGSGSDWFIVSRGDGVFDFNFVGTSGDVITYVS